MPTFPIPVFVSCVLEFAAMRLWHHRGRFDAITGLLLLCAVQSLIIALNQHYQVPSMRYLQPMVGALIPPTAWLTYRRRLEAVDALHLLGPGAALLALLLTPGLLDALLPALFATYGAAIIVHARRGADGQPNARLSSGDVPAHIWLVIGAVLVASAFSDVLIVAAQALGYPMLQTWIVSVFAVGNLLIIGMLSLSPHLQTVDEEPPGGDARTDAPPPPEPDAEIWERVQAYMARHEPYLDPDLTLSRLARKLGMPAKVLSTTINRATGGNVSRYINEARIEAAQRAIRDGEAITSALYASGFNTKSNFNREFRRFMGMSPSEWLAQAKAAPTDQT
ncbi:MAG: helix-turn-helix transcriptional regulator [Devosiaceae bacterium]|nr:helix-turn-helix transcriptional regulator [Devosiaceae bacterium MH13]